MSETTDRFAKDLRTKTLEELATITASVNPGHYIHTGGMVEFTRREAEWQAKTAAAQIRAAEAEESAARAATLAANAESDAARAAIETAAATEQNARYMLWSVIAAAISAFASLISTAIAVFGHH